MTYNKHHSVSLQHACMLCCCLSSYCRCNMQESQSSEITIGEYSCGVRPFHLLHKYLLLHAHTVMQPQGGGCIIVWCARLTSAAMGGYKQARKEGYVPSWDYMSWGLVRYRWNTLWVLDDQATLCVKGRSPYDPLVVVSTCSCRMWDGFTGYLSHQV